MTKGGFGELGTEFAHESRMGAQEFGPNLQAYFGGSSLNLEPLMQ